MALSYAEQLRHPFWQRKRLEVLQTYNFSCAQCGSSEKSLHVHHRRYIKKKMAWDYEDRDLVVLCEECHEFHHGWQSLLDELVASLPPAEIATLTAIVGGYIEGMGYMDEARDKVGAASSSSVVCGVIAARLRRASYNCVSREALSDAICKISELLEPLENGEK